MTANTHKTLLHSLRLITILGVAFVGFHFEAIQNSMSWLHNLDLRSYNWISKLQVRKPRPQWVIGVEIDDRTFYDYLNLTRGDATDRNALADIVNKSASQGAAVIVLDINLTRETLDSEEPRKSANRALLAAIKRAETMHIPVVLAFGFEITGPARYPQEHIFNDNGLPDLKNEAVPYRIRFGFDEAPPDMRAVPLVVPGSDGHGNKTEYSSLALQTVDAYEATLGISPRTRNALSKQIKKYQFIWTSFFPQSQFSKVSAKDVLMGETHALDMLRHRIVIIGGNRHISKNSPDWLDSGVIAPLEMRGMYFHANRIEGLLDNRLSTPVSHWTAFFIDLVLGALILYTSTRAASLRGRLGVLGIFFIPVALAYIAFVNLGYVVDFVAALVLLLLHGFGDHYLDLRFKHGAPPRVDKAA